MAKIPTVTVWRFADRHRVDINESDFDSTLHSLEPLSAGAAAVVPDVEPEAPVEVPDDEGDGNVLDESLPAEGDEGAEEDLADMTVTEVEEAIENVETIEELDDLKNEEAEGKKRKGVFAAIEARREALTEEGE